MLRRIGTMSPPIGDCLISPPIGGTRRFQAPAPRFDPLGTPPGPGHAPTSPFPTIPPALKPILRLLRLHPALRLGFTLWDLLSMWYTAPGFSLPGWTKTSNGCGNAEDIIGANFNDATCSTYLSNPGANAPLTCADAKAQNIPFNWSPDLTGFNQLTTFSCEGTHPVFTFRINYKPSARYTRNVPGQGANSAQPNGGALPLTEQGPLPLPARFPQIEPQAIPPGYPVKDAPETLPWDLIGSIPHNMGHLVPLERSEDGPLPGRQTLPVPWEPIFGREDDPDDELGPDEEWWILWRGGFGPGTTPGDIIDHDPDEFRDKSTEGKKTPKHGGNPDFDFSPNEPTEGFEEFGPPDPGSTGPSPGGGVPDREDDQPINEQEDPPAPEPEVEIVFHPEEVTPVDTPPREVKEGKVFLALPKGRLMKFIGDLTETGDLVDCLHKGLKKEHQAKAKRKPLENGPQPKDGNPDGKKRGTAQPSFKRKAEALWQHWDDIVSSKEGLAGALKACAENEAKDRAFGKVGQKMAEANRRNRVPHGVSLGPDVLGGQNKISF